MQYTLCNQLFGDDNSNSSLFVSGRETGSEERFCRQ
jgi:hypothetical protein